MIIISRLQKRAEVLMDIVKKTAITFLKYQEPELAELKIELEDRK
jgi:hypothetical protein